MKIEKLFQRTRFGIFAVFGAIVLSTSALCVYTVNTELSTEYETNTRNIAKTVADSSVDILLNRDMATLQSLLDQFIEIQGIRYIYITSEAGEYLAHTFVPGIPEEILASDHRITEPVQRDLPGLGIFLEVGSPILAGVAGHVHVGMDLDVIGLKVQRAIGQQIYLVAVILVIGVLAAIWLVNQAAGPLGELLAYAVELARDGNPEALSGRAVLSRDDEAGHLARLFLFVARNGGNPGAAGAAPPAD